MKVIIFIVIFSFLLTLCEDKKDRAPTSSVMTQNKKHNASTSEQSNSGSEKLIEELKEKNQNEEDQLICLAILNEVYEATNTNNIRLLSKLAYERFDVCPGYGTNDGCTHLKMALMNLKKPYEGENLSDKDFDYAVRKIASAAQLLNSTMVPRKESKTCDSYIIPIETQYITADEMTALPKERAIELIKACEGRKSNVWWVWNPTDRTCVQAAVGAEPRIMMSIADCYMNPIQDLPETATVLACTNLPISQIVFGKSKQVCLDAKRKSN